ncbi:MAG: hypothetical protein AVDCRST_MAG54-3392, partial [uncultured Actinomycetospora sp.]
GPSTPGTRGTSPRTPTSGCGCRAVVGAPPRRRRPGHAVLVRLEPLGGDPGPL